MADYYEIYVYFISIERTKLQIVIIIMKKDIANVTQKYNQSSKIFKSPNYFINLRFQLDDSFM